MDVSNSETKDLRLRSDINMEENRLNIQHFIQAALK